MGPTVSAFRRFHTNASGLRSGAWGGRKYKRDGANLLGESPEIPSGMADSALNAFDPGLAPPHKYP